MHTLTYRLYLNLPKMKSRMTISNVMRFLKIALIVAVVCLAPLLSSAQEEGLPCDGNDVDTQCPLDGGVIALMAAGAFFGLKKLAVK